MKWNCTQLTQFWAMATSKQWKQHVSQQINQPSNSQSLYNNTFLQYHESEWFVLLFVLLFLFIMKHWLVMRKLTCRCCNNSILFVLKHKYSTSFRFPCISLSLSIFPFLFPSFLLSCSLWPEFTADSSAQAAVWSSRRSWHWGACKQQLLLPFNIQSQPSTHQSS